LLWPAAAAGAFDFTVSSFKLFPFAIGTGRTSNLDVYIVLSLIVFIQNLANVQFAKISAAYVPR